MALVGQIFEIKLSEELTTTGMILKIDRSWDRCLIALVTKSETLNCSRIFLGEDLFLYPSVQGYVSLSWIRGKSKSNLASSQSWISEVAYVWPTLFAEEKLKLQGLHKERINLGDSRKSFADDFVSAHNRFYETVENFQHSSRLGIQFHEKLAFGKSGFRNQSSESWLLGSSAAIFSSKQVTKEVEKLSEAGQTDLARLLTLRAIKLKSLKGSDSSRSRAGEMADYFRFMEYAGIYSMVMLCPKTMSKPKVKKLRSGSLVLNLKVQN